MPISKTDNNESSIGAVVIGGDFQGLGVIRSLCESGVQVFLLEYERSIGRFSRYIKRRALDSVLLSRQNFAEYLIDLAKKENLRGWVLFPNSDEVVRLLSQNREKLIEWYLNPVPDWEIVKKFYLKNLAYQIAESLSIPTPKLYSGNTLKDFLNQKLKFPIILKPSRKNRFFYMTHKKAIKARNIEEFAKSYRQMSSLIDPSEIVVQEMIEGGPQNLYSYATFFDGEKPLAGLAARRWRQHPMDFGHATTYAESVHVPELGNLATRLLKELGYYGLAEVEFMKDDRDGVFKFIEINGRPWGWHTLAKAAGINLPIILFQHMSGKECEIKKPIIGVKWLRLTTDIPIVLLELTAGRMKLREYFQSLRGKKEFAVFSRKDPLPFFMELVMIPYLFWKRGF